MERSDVGSSDQIIVKTFATEWVKKSLPFIETGLAAAKVYLN